MIDSYKSINIHKFQSLIGTLTGLQPPPKRVIQSDRVTATFWQWFLNNLPRALFKVYLYAMSCKGWQSSEKEQETLVVSDTTSSAGTLEDTVQHLDIVTICNMVNLRGMNSEKKNVIPLEPSCKHLLTELGPKVLQILF